MELKIKKETAKEIYEGSPDALKKIFEETFGKDYFKKGDWKDIKTIEDAAKEIGYSACYLIIQYNHSTEENESTDEWAYRMLKMVTKAINQGWTPDWNNSNQKKWWPWFNLSSGFGFSLTNYCYVLTFSSVGSRLCFESDEKATYAAKQFIDLYKEFLI